LVKAIELKKQEHLNLVLDKYKEIQDNL